MTMTKLNLLLLTVLVACVMGPLSGCAGSIDVPKETRVEIPVACVKPEDRPKAPQIRSEADLKAMDRYRRTLASWSDRLKMIAYARELEAIVEGCSRIPSSQSNTPRDRTPAASLQFTGRELGLEPGRVAR